MLAAAARAAAHHQRTCRLLLLALLLIANLLARTRNPTVGREGPSRAPFPHKKGVKRETIMLLCR